MKCICGSGANEEIKRLRDLGQDVRVDNFATPQLREKIEDLKVVCQTLEKRVIALRELWGESLKANEVLQVNVRVLTKFMFSSRL